MSPLHDRFLAVVDTVPTGVVATYGQIAALAGLPRHARHVGVALRHLPDNSPTPWWRVINSQGRIPPRGLDGHDEWQRLQLEQEGVCFSEDGRIRLSQFGWKP